MTTTDPTTPTRWTTCECSDGRHVDPRALLRSTAYRDLADIVAQVTVRHVVPVSEIRTEVAA
jgi:hypothetical protein